MPTTSAHDKPDLGEKRVVFLEFVGAFTILAIMALVLYMVFTYRPA